MFTQKVRRIARILLIGLLAGSILAANAPAASAMTAGCTDVGGGTFRCCFQDKQGYWHCNYFA